MMRGCYLPRLESEGHRSKFIYVSGLKRVLYRTKNKSFRDRSLGGVLKQKAVTTLIREFLQLGSTTELFTKHASNVSIRQWK